MPDAVVYKVDLGLDSKAKDVRAALAMSLVYQGAIFLDISADYGGPFLAAPLAERVQTDFDRITELLGLTERPTLSDNRAL